MNKSLTQALGFGTALLMLLTACKKDEVKATLSPDSTPTLTSTTSTVVLAQANAAQTAVVYSWKPITSFTWSNAEHPYNPAVTYTLQVDKQGNNFAGATTIDAGAGPNTTLTVAALDAALLKLGLTPGKATAVEVRLLTVYANNSPMYSAAMPLTATAYLFCAQPKETWNLIGPAGISWDTDVIMTYDCDTQTYFYTGPLNTGSFKFRYNKSWTANLGGSSSTGGTLTQDGSDMTIAKAGTYTIVLTPKALGSDGKATGGSYTIK